MPCGTPGDWDWSGYRRPVCARDRRCGRPRADATAPSSGSFQNPPRSLCDRDVHELSILQPRCRTTGPLKGVHDTAGPAKLSRGWLEYLVDDWHLPRVDG